MFVYILILIALGSFSILFVPLRLKALVATALICAAGGFSSFEALNVLFSGNTMSIPLGVWQYFGEQHATIDPLSAIFLIMISIASIASAIYSAGDLKRLHDSLPSISFSIHYIALVVMVVSMMLVVVVSSGFSFILAWEMMTISSFVLMILESHRREVIRAALSYLLIMHVGFILLITGFISMRVSGIPPGLDNLNVYFDSLQTSPIPIFVVLLLGFGFKAGMFPLHWIKPITDPISPTHVAALMSGVMIKTGVYGVIRVVCAINSSLYTIGLIVLGVGLVTGLWGIIMASAQNNIKKLLAYSSVENVGIMFIGIGVSILGRHWGNDAMTVLGMGGAILHALNHSLFKPLLIMGAGAVQHSTGTLNLDRLGGIAVKMPITALLFIVGSAAISALPPLNGFVGEFLIYSGLFESIAYGNEQAIASIATLIFFAFISGIVILTFTKLYGVIFLGSPRGKESQNAKEVNSTMIVAGVIPLAGVIVLGFYPSLVYDAIIPMAARISGVRNYYGILESSSHSATMISLVIGIFVVVSAVLWFLRKRVVAVRGQKHGAVWGCGFTAIDTTMQYTGESFSDELHSITESVTLDKLNTVDVSKHNLFFSSKNFEVRHKDKFESLFTGWWVGLIRRINSKVDLFVTNRVNHYVLYALGFLVFIFLLSILNLI